MRAYSKLKNIKSDHCRQVIIRNLSKVLNIRILEVGVNEKSLVFLFSTPRAFHKVKEELSRIGYPMLTDTLKILPPKSGTAKVIKRVA